MSDTKYRFELIGEGKYSEGRKVWRKGDVIETDKNLAKAFPDRFKKYRHHHAEETDTEGETVQVKGLKAKGSEKESKEDPALAARGVEVTGKFKVDAKLLQVFQRGDVFHVFEAGSTTPLNKTGLKRAKVEAFATKHLEE